MSTHCLCGPSSLSVCCRQDLSYHTQLRTLFCQRHQICGFRHLFPVGFPFPQPHLTLSCFSGHFLLSCPGSSSSFASMLLSPGFMHGSFWSYSAVLWSSLWLGPSLCSELPILLLLHSHSLRVDLTVISQSFISTFLHVDLELQSHFKWMSLKNLKVSRTGLISLLPHLLLY